MVVLDRLGAQSKPVQLNEVSKITGISKRYLEQLAIALKSHSLIRGVCGRNGGYVLARPTAQISIGQVLTAVIGPINLSTCVADPAECMRAEFCECRLIWQVLYRRINEVLDEYSIADLSNKRIMDTVRRQLLSFEEKPAHMPVRDLS